MGCKAPILHVPSCETPKSPPGDYNAGEAALREMTRTRPSLCVKHLNPRQGITTRNAYGNPPRRGRTMCETPKSPPGDYNAGRWCTSAQCICARWCETPKSPPGDYNPSRAATSGRPSAVCVKHLNPRQGITTGHRVAASRPRATPARARCETPKSPPGDYNFTLRSSA